MDWMVDPKVWYRIRTHRSSYTSPVAPEKKNSRLYARAALERMQLAHRLSEILYLGQDEILELLGGDQRALRHRAVRHDGQVTSLAHALRLAERDHEVGARVGRLVVRLAVQVFVFQKQHGVVAPDRGPQQAVRVECGAGADHAQPRHGREDHGARLRVIDRPAFQVSAVGHSNDRGTAEGVVRAPAQRRQLVAELMIRGPDVIEELDLHDGLQAAGREPDGPAHDVRLGERRVVHAVAPELAL